MYKSGHLESIFVEIILPKNLFSYTYRHPSMDKCNFNNHYLNPLLEKYERK